MFKKIVIVIILIIFAKPAYDVVKPFVDPLIHQTDIQTTTDEVAPVEQVIEPTDDEKISEASLPKIIDSTQSLTDAFYYYFTNYEENFEIKYVGKTKDIAEQIDEAANEAAKRDPFIEGHLATREVSFSYTKWSASIKVKQQYLITAEQAATVNVTVDELLTKHNVYALSEFDKVKFVNDYVVQHIVYSTDTVSTPHSAYTALAEGKAVCQGYALLAQIMLTKLGIPSLYVVGDAGGESHAWNLVQLNNKWYHLDTTWNDPTPDRGPSSVRYAYFLLSDAQLAKDHNWIQENYPNASDESYSYMHNIGDNYETGNVIYYSNDQDDQKLYSLNKQTKQNSKLADIRVQYIVGKNDWLYFSNYSHGGYLAKMKTNGDQLTYLVSEEVKNLSIDNQYLYFTTASGTKKIQLP